MYDWRDMCLTGAKIHKIMKKTTTLTQVAELFGKPVTPGHREEVKAFWHSYADLMRSVRGPHLKLYMPPQSMGAMNVAGLAFQLAQICRPPVAEAQNALRSILSMTQGRLYDVVQDTEYLAPGIMFVQNQARTEGALPPYEPPRLVDALYIRIMIEVFELDSAIRGAGIVALAPFGGNLAVMPDGRIEAVTTDPGLIRPGVIKIKKQI